MKYLLPLALIASPASAATYGPELPTVPQTYEPVFMDMAKEIERKDDTRSAWRTFWLGQGLVATDIALTCAILAQGGHEKNPIYGRGASCGKIAGIRAGVSVLQYILARRAISKDPAGAKRGFRIVFAVQGVPVIWNAIQLAK